MPKFKIGDKVVLIQTLKDYKSVVIGFDYQNPYCDYIEVEDDEGYRYWARTELLVLEEVYNSKLYKALNES